MVHSTTGPRVATEGDEVPEVAKTGPSPADEIEIRRRAAPRLDADASFLFDGPCEA